MTIVRNGQATVLLKKLGVNPAHLGWTYLNEAINLTIEDVHNVFAMTNVMYPKIAKKYDVSANSVERCMRHAIKRAFAVAPLAALKAVFGNTINDSCIANSQFVATCAQVITDEPNNPVWQM